MFIANDSSKKQEAWGILGAPAGRIKRPLCRTQKKASSRAFSDTEFESTLMVMVSYEIKDPGSSPGSFVSFNKWL